MWGLAWALVAAPSPDALPAVGGPTRRRACSCAGCPSSFVLVGGRRDWQGGLPVARSVARADNGGLHARGGVYEGASAGRLGRRPPRTPKMMRVHLRPRIPATRLGRARWTRDDVTGPQPPEFSNWPRDARYYMCSGTPIVSVQNLVLYQSVLLYTGHISVIIWVWTMPLRNQGCTPLGWCGVAVGVWGRLVAELLESKIKMCQNGYGEIRSGETDTSGRESLQMKNLR